MPTLSQVFDMCMHVYGDTWMCGESWVATRDL